MGHSLGGLVTATSVVLDPTRVTGVILSSPALLVSANVITRGFARLVSWVAPRLPVRFLPPAGISRDLEVVKALVADPMVFHGGMSARLAASILFTSRENWARYAEWPAPTFVMHGTADTFTEPDGSRRFAETIASSDKTIYLVDGGYHELLNDFGAAETLDVVLTWLSRRLPSDAGGIAAPRSPEG